MTTRTEHDSLGELEVPAEAYYGIQTLRALKNFPITGIPISRYPAMVRALGAIKQAAALANADLGQLEKPIAEAVANRALECLGHPRGAYAYCHPNNHVNLSQSTNDVVPTAIKVAAIWKIRSLRDALGALQDAFAVKGEQFKDVLKMGRTQLQDAVPMTLGQEFIAFSVGAG